MEAFRLCPGPEELFLEVQRLVRNILEDSLLLWPGSQVVKPISTMRPWGVLLKVKQITDILGCGITPSLHLV